MDIPSWREIFDLQDEASPVRGKELLERVPWHSLPEIATPLLGWMLPSPLGIPSCPLTINPDRTEFFARCGFDLLTVKTYRSRPWPPHPAPRWAFARVPGDSLGVSPTLGTAVASAEPMATSLADESMANSVGVPSTEPTAWQASLNATRERLGPGQRLIASVMGSPEVATSPSELASDFALAVKLAAETSTDAIELNLSCPNTRGAIVCQSPDIAVEVCAAAAAAIASSAKPLLAKVSYLPPDALEAFTLACAPHLQGVIAINTVAQQIVDHAGQPYFPGRPTAGISGRAIFEAGLDTVRRLTALRTAHRLDLAIIGVGGVMTPGDFDAYLEAGANAVQTCTGAYLYPTLAITYRRQHAQRAAKSAVVASVS